MPSLRLLLLISAPLLLSACSTTRPPVLFPDLAAENMPRQSLATLREDEHCFVASVDDHYITQYDINPIAPATYRQLLLPPGAHTLAIFYRQQRNLETVTAGPRYITLTTQPGATYSLASNANGALVPFADTLDTANWRPAVLDSSTHRQVAISKINDR